MRVSVVPDFVTGARDRGAVFRRTVEVGTGEGDLLVRLRRCGVCSLGPSSNVNATTLSVVSTRLTSSPVSWKVRAFMTT